MASAAAPPPLPQSSTNKTFAAGSFIIDAGWMGSPAAATQPKTVLQQYGLIYRLLVTEKIPVYWIIADGKDGTVGSAPSLANMDADLTGVSVFSPYDTTSPTPITKSYYSGPFVIPAEYLNNAKLTAILGALAPTAITGVRVDKAAAQFTAPVYDKVTHWPRATLDDQNGGIAQGFYTNAKIPESVYSYNWKAPSELNACDDIFIMPHADPTWAVHNNLVPFNDQGGYIWAGCHAASVLENVDSPDADLYPNMNFLTTEGLLDFGDHGGGSMPYFYGENLDVRPWTSLTAPGTGTPGTATADRSDPAMQIIGATETAHQNGSEQIYMPNPEGVYNNTSVTSRWNPGVRFLSWDPTQADVLAGGSPGVAAADVYGRGFDGVGTNPLANGLVMYQGGHSINKGSVGDTPAQRAFFNFLLLGGIERAPEVEINRTGLPMSLPSGGTQQLTAVISKGSPSYSYVWQSSCGGSFSPATGVSGSGIPVTTTFSAPNLGTATPCQVTIVAKDSCDRQVFDSIGFQVMPAADVKIAKTASPTVSINGTINYTLTVTNDGLGAAADVVVTDTLPAGVTYVLNPASPAPASVSGQTLTWTYASIPSGESRTITFQGTAPGTAGQTLNNVAHVASTTPDPNSANNTANASTQVINSGISITKVARPEIVPSVGGTVTFEFEVKNTGDNPLSNVVVSDDPACSTPNPLTRISGDLNSDNKLNEPYSLGVDREVWRYSCTRTVTTGTPEGPAGGPWPDASQFTKQDVVTVTATDAGGNTLTDQEAVTVRINDPRITVTKTLEPLGQRPAPGQLATFRVVVKNDGNVPLSNVDTTDFWVVPTSPAPGTCDTATIPNLPVGGSFSMLCTAKTPDATASDSFATIAYNGGSGWVNNWTETGDDAAAATGTVSVVPAPAMPSGTPASNAVKIEGKNVSLARTVNTTGLTNPTLSFTYHRSWLFNDGGKDLGVYASLNGTNWTQLGTLIPPDGTKNPDSSWTTWSAAIPPALIGATTQIRFSDGGTDLSKRTIYVDNVQILATRTNNVTAKGYGPFGDMVEATATAPVTPGTPPLSITKTATNTGPVAINGTFNYIVTVTNNGTQTQTGVVVKDLLPSGLELAPGGVVSATKPTYVNAFHGFGTDKLYTGGDGWATTSWTETGETTSPTADTVQVDDGKGDPKSAVKFANTKNTDRSLSRTVDLTGMNSGNLYFDCDRESGTWGGSFTVYLGGALAGTATSLCSTNSGDAPYAKVSFAIPAAALNQVSTLEFRVIQPNDNTNRAVWLDNVYVAAKNPSVSTNPSWTAAGNTYTLTDSGGPYTIAMGDSVTFTIPVKVTGAPADGFQFSNLAQSTSAQQLSPVSAAVTTPYYLAPSFDITKTAIETWVNYGDAATYNVKYVVELRNTGNATLTPVPVAGKFPVDPSCTLGGLTGDLPSTLFPSGDGKLQVGEIWRYTCTRSVTTPPSPPDPDPDVVPNTVTAEMKDPLNNAATDTASAYVRVIHPSIDLTVSPSNTSVLIGGTVTYTYTLDNNGDIGITSPTVIAANCPAGQATPPTMPATYSTGDIDFDGILDVTETWTFTCTTGPINADQLNPPVTATGKDFIFASTVQDSETVAVTVINPSMTVVKTAQNYTETPGDPIAVGYPNLVTYHYAVTNTGTVPLTEVKGIDDKCSPISPASASLAVGATVQFTCAKTVSLEVETTNTVQFDAKYPVGTGTGTVSATDTAHVDVLKPKILLKKEASATRARIGGQVTYTYLLTNTGATSFFAGSLLGPSLLGNLTDDKCSPVAFDAWVTNIPGGLLDFNFDPGDQRRYTCTATIGTAPATVLDDRVINTVTMGLSTDTFGSNYTPSPATASVFVIDPDFTVAKVATTAIGGTGVDIDGEAGLPVAYTFTVAHSITTPTGNFLDELNALSLGITDDKCSAPIVALDANSDGIIDGDTDDDRVLDLGETWTPTGDTNANGVVDPYETWTSGGVTFGDTNTNGVQDPDEIWTTAGFIFGDDDDNALLNPGETWKYGCTLAALPDGEARINTVQVIGTVVERTLKPDGITPADLNDGLGPITHTATATVTPLSVKITVEKRSLNCDVGVPVCDSDIPGTEFTLYDSDPLLPGAGTGEILPNTPTGSATFLSDYVLVNHDYWLVETKAPAGFQLLAEPIKFHVTTTELTLDPSTASSLITADAETFTITVTDVPGADLPKVGGNGIVWYLAIGLLLIAAAGLYYRSTSGPPRVSRRAM